MGTGMTRLPTLRMGLGAMVTVLGACGSSAEAPPPTTESMAPMTPVAAGPIAAEPPAVCEQTPEISPTQTARFKLSLQAKMGGAAAELGTAMTATSGHGYELTFFAFYLSDFQLVDQAAQAHPATVLGADGKPRVYNLQLINLDDPSSLSIELAAPPGHYQALRFSVGVSSACNTLDPPNRSWPLSIESEMNWGWTMLHARIEGFRLDPTRQGFMYHLGFPEEFRALTVLGDIELPRAASSALELDLEQLFAAPADALAPASELNVADGFARAGTFTLK